MYRFHGAWEQCLVYSCSESNEAIYEYYDQLHAVGNCGIEACREVVE